jgi:hypothetical protein
MGLNTTPRTWTAGEKPPASTFNTEIRDPLTGIQAAWTTYTPNWTATTTNPTIGNGTLAGRYMQVGKTITFSIQITWGSTSTVGSGRWIFSLPVNNFAGANSPFNCIARAVGNAMRFGILAGTSTFSLYDTAGTAMTDATFTWANGNVLAIQGSYEAA